MSILLEALKKSEERRQLGKTPDIHDPVDHVPLKDEKRGFPWLPSILVLVAMGAVFWLVWNQYRAPEIAAVSPSPQVSERRQPGMSASQPGGQENSPGNVAAAQAVPPASAARTPVESFTASEAGEGQQGAGSQDPDAERKQQLAENFNNFRQPEDTPLEEDGGPAATEPPAAAPPPARTAPARGAQLASNQAAAAEKPRETGPVSYWELPQNVRDSMPEFRISVLVYAENPADRFMLLNGRRMVEKDTVNGVELEEIRRDGAVFRYRNYRFLVRD